MSKKSQPQGHRLLLQQQVHQGPIPDPESLARYDSIVPGAAERIISMAEKEAKHRHSIEIRSVKNSIGLSYLGVIFAFLSVIMLSVLVFYALKKNFDTTAAWIAVGAIASVASVFIFFRRSKKKGKSIQ